MEDESLLTPEQRDEQIAGFNYVFGEQSFPDELCEQAYRDYMYIVEQKPFSSDATPESTQAAIKFLGAICDYYLNKQDGDFMEIRRSDKWQR